MDGLNLLGAGPLRFTTRPKFDGPSGTQTPQPTRQPGRPEQQPTQQPKIPPQSRAALSKAALHASSAGRKLLTNPRTARTGKKLIARGNKATNKAKTAVGVTVNPPPASQPKYVASFGPLTYQQGAAYRDVLAAEAQLTDAMAGAGDLLSTVTSAITVLQQPQPGSTLPPTDPMGLVPTGQGLATQIQGLIDQFISDDGLVTDLDAATMQNATATMQQLQSSVAGWMGQVQTALQGPQAPPSGGGGGGGGGGGDAEEPPPDDASAEPEYEAEEAPAPEYEEAQPDDEDSDAEGEQMSDEDSGLDVLGAEDIFGGGGGHGGHGGHHGGHGGHRGGGRGFRGGGFYGYGGPWWYDEPWYYEGLEDEMTADQFAALVAKHLRQKKTHVGYVAPETHWYTIATPGDQLAEMDKVMREADTLNADVMAYPGEASFKTAWGAFLAEYKKFYDDNKGWFSRLSSSTGDHIVSYGNQLNDWREKFRGFRGARVTEPKLTAVQVRSDPSKFNWKPLVIGGVVVAGLFGGGYALSKVSAVGSLFKRRA